MMVRTAGVEPALPNGEEDFKSPASTVPPRPLGSPATVALPALLCGHFVYVQALAHSLAGCEIGHALGVDGHRSAIAAIAPNLRIALTGRERTETAKPHAPT